MRQSLPVSKVRPKDCLKPLSHSNVTGTRVGRVKVLFKLPRVLPQNQGGRSAPAWWPTGPLAYVEWYTKFAAAADPTHLMYTVRKQPPATNGLPQGKIVPLSQIRQSCQLIPSFPGGVNGAVPLEWTSENALDNAAKLLLNNMAGQYAYQTLW